MKKGRRKISQLDQITIGALSIVVSCFIIYFAFMLSVTLPYQSLENQAIKVAKVKAGLVSASSFSIVTTNQTTYTVTGKDAQGAAIGVLIPKNGGGIQVVTLSHGKEPSSGACLGLFNNQPVWQINTSTDFKLYSFTSGKEIQ